MASMTMLCGPAVIITRCTLGRARSLSAAAWRSASDTWMPTMAMVRNPRTRGSVKVTILVILRSSRLCSLLPAYARLMPSVLASAEMDCLPSASISLRIFKSRSSRSRSVLWTIIASIPSSPRGIPETWTCRRDVIESHHPPGPHSWGKQERIGGHPQTLGRKHPAPLRIWCFGFRACCPRTLSCIPSPEHLEKSRASGVACQPTLVSLCSLRLPPDGYM